MPYGAAVLRRNNKRSRSTMVSAGERTPDYGHTPASLVNGVGADPACPPKSRVATPKADAHVGAPPLDGREWKTVLIIVLNLLRPPMRHAKALGTLREHPTQHT